MKDEIKKEEMEEVIESDSKSKQNTSLINKLLNDSSDPPKVDDLIEGVVIGIEKAAVYVDIFPFGTGIIFGKEYISTRDIIKKINIGDSIAGKVVSVSNEDGYYEISLKEARQALIWSEADDAIRDKRLFELQIQDANKGGLMLSWQGIIGFLPASQLKTEHYPRVADGDKDRILEELKKFVGQKITVSIIGASPKEGKLIFSEKNITEKIKEGVLDKYNVGDVVLGEVTGTVDFGVFIKIEDGLEGLVHISEIDWALVENPKLMFNVGEKIKVKIIEIKDGKISLSIKALKENPWQNAEIKYKKDDIVEAVIIKFNKHGALASIEEGVSGLVHISEFGSEEKLKEQLQLGKRYSFKISIFDPKEQKMTLSFVDKNKDNENKA